METSRMEEFVVFAQYMNFSKAAQRLHISQPTLSNHIAALEKELDCTLVERGTPLQLTPAGYYFLDEATAILDKLNAAIAHAKELHRNGLRLTVSTVSSYNCSGASFGRLLVMFQNKHPEVTVTEQRSTFDSAHEELVQGATDLVVISVTQQQRDIDAGVLFHEIPSYSPNRLGVWIDEADPLAQKSEVHWDDLNGYMFPMDINSGLLARGVMEMLDDHGLTYSTRTISQPGTGFFFAFRPDEIILKDETVASLPACQVPGRCFRLLDEPDAWSKTFAACLPNNHNPALKLFLRFLESVERN